MSKETTTFDVSFNPYEKTNVIHKRVTIAHTDRCDFVDVEDLAIEAATKDIESENVEATPIKGYFA